MFYHRCTKLLGLVFLICLTAITNYAQFPETIKVSSKNDKTYQTTSVTDPKKFYRITVTGTYRMWSDQLTNNADAVCIYDIPNTVYGSKFWPGKDIVNSKGQTVESMPKQIYFSNKIFIGTIKCLINLLLKSFLFMIVDLDLKDNLLSNL